MRINMECCQNKGKIWIYCGKPGLWGLGLGNAGLLPALPFEMKNFQSVRIIRFEEGEVVSGKLPDAFANSDGVRGFEQPDGLFESVLGNALLDCQGE